MKKPTDFKYLYDLLFTGLKLTCSCKNKHIHLTVINSFFSNALICYANRMLTQNQKCMTQNIKQNVDFVQ